MCRGALGESEGEPSETGSQGVEEHVVDVGAVDTGHGHLGQLDAKRGSDPQGHDSPPVVELGPAQRQQQPKGQKSRMLPTCSLSMWMGWLLWNGLVPLPRSGTSCGV
jgi:hypothetical protein